LSEDAKVYLSELGVAAARRDDKKRQTFVGTPCWMAPEVLEQTSGYDYKADIWSFGITALELAYGEAPYQRLHPLKVMKIIIEKDPPRIDRRKWDSSFVALVEGCLQKDPKKRPNMEEVSTKNAKFFSKASEKPLQKIIDSLPPLDQRVPAKPNFSGQPEKPPEGTASKDNRPAGESWDFKIDDCDEFDPLEGLPEQESAG